METTMSFNYTPILEKASCFILIKNLRYFEDNQFKGIENGEILSYASELTKLMSELNRSNLNFNDISQLKRFLYMNGFFTDLRNLEGDYLVHEIEEKRISEITPELNDELSCEENLKILFKTEKLRRWEVMYDFGGTAYHKNNKLRDYQVFDETFDIHFFGGKDTNILFDL